MQFFYRTKGAVSVFLVLVLVPMLTISSLFVDISKVRLGRAMSVSAGDLAVNTALTNYDTDLKELYGLMATAQDTADLFMKLEDYYTASLISAGLSAEDSVNFIKSDIMPALGMVSESNDVSDIMKMQVVEFTADKYSNGNLANASILKKQIVDFMKYRCPINTGLSFISSLKSFSTLSKQTKLIEKKQAYYKEQQTVLEHLKEAWSHIAAYNESKIATTTGYVKKVAEDMNILANGGTIDGTTYNGYNQEDNKGMNNRVIWDLYNYSANLTYNYDVTTKATLKYKDPGEGSVVTITDEDYIKLNNEGEVYDCYDYYCEKYANGSYDLPTEEDFKTQLSSFYSYYSDVTELEEAIKNKTTFNESTQHKIRFYVNAMQGSEGVDDYSSKVAAMYMSWQKLKAMEIWVYQYDNIKPAESESEDDTESESTDDSKEDTEEEEVETVTSADILGKSISLKSESHQTGTKTISEWCKSAKKDFGEAMSKFIGIAEKFEVLSDEVNGEYTSSMGVVKSELPKISAKAKEYKKEFTDAKSHLDSAITSLNNAKNQLTGKVADAKSAWNGAASDGSIQDTSLAKQDKAEIQQLDKYLNTTNIDKLITRLTNVKNNLEKDIAEIEKYKCGGKFIGDIDSYDTLKGIFVNTIDTSKLTSLKSDLRSYADTWGKQNFTSGELEYSWVGTSSSQPNLNLDKPALYNYLYSNFASVAPAGEPDVKEEDPANGKNFYENIKRDASSKADEEAEKANGDLVKEPEGESKDGDDKKDETKKTEISKKENLPSKSKDVEGGDTPSSKVDTNVDSGAGSASSGLDSLFGESFGKALAGFGEDLLEKVYISDYIMSMFSYDTIEKEYIKKNNAKEVKAGDILSLTQCDISAANNYAYGDEVEYIIYGGTYAENSAKAYATIYGIRFGFNVIYAFATSEIRDSALAIATPISAATCGIIPVPLIQAAIIIGIAACESGLDLAELSNGAEIPLYKTSKTWRCSISGLTNYAKDKAKEFTKKAAEDAIDASVEKVNELLDKASDEIGANITEYSEQAGTAITSIYDKVITENAEVAIQQLTTYVNTAVNNVMCFDEAAADYENKKKEMIGWVKSELTAWGNQFTGDDIISIVKREAVNAIVANSETCIEGLFNKVEESIKSSELGSEVSDVLEGVSGGIDGIDRLGGEVMECIGSVRIHIKTALDSATNKVQEFKNQVAADIKNSTAEGAESLKKTLNEKIDGVFGKGEDSIGNANGNPTGAAAFFNFSYSDYLRLFLLIGTICNEEKILLRTADVIQVNMAECITKNSKYVLSESAAYINITAKVQVKPTMLALPLFANVEKNPISQTGWYTFTYKGIGGY